MTTPLPPTGPALVYALLSCVFLYVAASCLLLFFFILKPSMTPYGTGFYKGRIAEALVAAVQERGGLMTLEDLSAHRCEHTDPIMSTYRGYHVYEVAPPTAVSPVFNRSYIDQLGIVADQADDRCCCVWFAFSWLQQQTCSGACHVGRGGGGGGGGRVCTGLG